MSHITSRGLRATAGVAFAIFACACSSKSSTPTSGSEGGSPAPVAWRAAVGTGGTVVQTFDDSTWSTRSVLAVDLYGVTCVGNLKGWASGANGTVAHTEDGGSTWTAQASHLSGNLRSIHFGDASLGVVAGDSGALAVTRDGGATWTPVTLSSANLRGVWVADDAGALFAVGDGGTFARSTDRGTTWSKITIPGAGDLYSVTADPSAHAILAVDSKGVIWSSSDGASWAQEATATGPLESIMFSDDGSRMIAAGAHGTVMLRDTSGAWSSANVPTKYAFHSALVSNDGEAYVAGDSGALFHRINGTWQAVSTWTNATLYGLDDL